MAFTTWTALYSQMLDDWADRTWMVKSYTQQDKVMTYRSAADFLDGLNFAKSMAERETGAFSPRTFGKPMRGGR